MLKNNLKLLDEISIKNKIYSIRGLKVILDRDLSLLYGVKSIRLREQVKRNIERFPLDFMFQLNDDEVDLMVSQNAIPSKKYLGGTNPYVFTEQGVANLSSVLTNKKAIEVNIEIMRTFVNIRKFLSRNSNLFQKISKIENDQLKFEINTKNEFEKIFNLLENKKLNKNQGIFFEGQIFDAHLFVSDLIRGARNNIILIDNYIDDTTLNLFSKRKKSVKTIIYAKLISKTLKLDLKKFNLQYVPLEIKKFKNSHDRFLIIDDVNIYHIGASLKDLGKKWFAFSKLDVDSLEILRRLK